MALLNTEKKLWNFDLRKSNKRQQRKRKKGKSKAKINTRWEEDRATVRSDKIIAKCSTLVNKLWPFIIIFFWPKKKIQNPIIFFSVASKANINFFLSGLERASVRTDKIICYAFIVHSCQQTLTVYFFFFLFVCPFSPNFCYFSTRDPMEKENKKRNSDV